VKTFQAIVNVVSLAVGLTAFGLMLDPGKVAAAKQWLATVPQSCWWWTGGMWYMLLTWALGAVWSRRQARGQFAYVWGRDYPPLELVWFLVPIWLPFFYPLAWLRRFLLWVIFGSAK
jgi:heme/copper-type cytochrome/quinol oxidase subunit 2